jgi:nitroimidazol reductase NimA-like FMN-containing flavoprotein (pyridoxamine 5'-phosphate oxidase superfamily)/GNAT superfamily N-acetyltransferase
MTMQAGEAPAFFTNAMRRGDLAWNDWQAVEAFLRDQAVCRLGVFDETHPYVVAQSYRFVGDAFLVHFSRFGRLAGLVRTRPNVTIEVSQAVSLLKAPAAENTSMEYRSVIARCTAELSAEDEPVEAQQYAALDKYRPERDYLPIDREGATRRIVTCRAVVTEMTAKKRILADGSRSADGSLPDYVRYPFPPPAALSSLSPDAFDPAERFALRRHDGQNPGVTVTTADSRRAAEIAPLFDAYRAFFTGGGRLAESTLFLSERLERGESVAFVADVDGRARGFAQLYPLWSSWHCGRIWFLSDLYVAEEARRRGVGALLVEAVKDHARRTRATSVMVELPQSEPHLYRFYDRLGFRRDEIFDLARFRP